MATAARRFATRLKGSQRDFVLLAGRVAPLACLLVVTSGCVQQPSAPVELPSQTGSAAPPAPTIGDAPPEPPIKSEVLFAEPGPAGFLTELRRSFQLDHLVWHPSVARQIEALAAQDAHGDHFAYLNDPDGARLDYLRYVCAEVRARSLPGELCLVPIVESALDPHAFSPQGAGGLWQFVPSTARQFGLKVDWWADERRDPVSATTAALDYLEQLHARFGDWLLALAAYNCGEGRLERALRRASGEATGFFDIDVPRETRNHVAKLLAYAALFARPEDFGVELPVGVETSAEADFAVVGTGSQIDLALAASAMGKSVEYLYQRNPALKRWATHPRGPHRLIVDGADRETAIDALEGLRDEERLRWQPVRVEANDTLGHLALRFGTDVATLRQMNGLPTTLIRTGDELLVPVGRIMRRPGTGIFAPRGSGTRAGSAFVYVVRAGDSIWRIARRLGVTRNALMQANGIDPRDILRIGQRLAVP
ncbi:MAG: transglycosylase SLT domain-containing protein [Gammaproteobacteria bacterium]|nr:transglycosylase SLT domain-containing protein [Gammaproteobacteria bacterium]